MTQKNSVSKSGVASSTATSTVVSQIVATAMPYRWVALAICFLAYGVSYMPRLGLGPLAPFMKTELALTKAQIGFFISAAMAGNAIFLIPAGYLADKVGVRWVLCFGQVVAGLFLIGMFFAETYVTVMVAMFAVGLGLGFLSPSTTKGVVEWFPLKERAMAMGIKQMSLNGAGLVTAVTLPMLAVAFGWRMGFIVLGIVAIVSGILSAIVYRDPPKDKQEAPVAVSTASSASVAPPVKKGSWLSVFRTREIWLIIAAGVTLYVGEFGMMTYFVLYLKTHLMISVVTAGFLLGALDVGGFFGKPIAGVISDRLWGGRRKPTFILLGILSTIFTAIFAILPVGTPQWLILVCAFGFGFAAIGWGGIYFTMVAECAGKEHAATVLGAGSVFLMIGNIVGVPLFGHISDVTGTWTWSFIYLVGLSAMGTVALLFVREEKRRLTT